MAFIPLYNEERDGYIRKYNRYGELLLEKQVSNIYHANSMTIYNNKIYLALMNNNAIKMFDMNLNELGQINCEVAVSSLSFKDNEMYTAGNTKDTIFVLDEKGSVLREIKLKGAFNRGINQSFTVRDHIYFVQSDPNTIHVFDLEGNLIRVVKPEINYTVKEYEDIEIIGEDIYLSYQTGNNVNQWNTGVVVLSYKNYVEELRMGQETDTAIVVYVNNEYSRFDGDGSKEKPFSNIQDALDNLTYRPSLAKEINVVKTTKDYEYFRFYGDTNLTIVGNNNKFKGFDSYMSTNIVVRNMNIKHSGIGNYICEIQNSKIVFRDCTFEIKGNEKAINSIYNSNVLFIGGTSSLPESSVVVQSGGYFFANRTNLHDMVLPYGVTWRSEVPINIWKGNADVGTGKNNFRKEIKNNVFNKLIFEFSNGDFIEKTASSGNKEFRLINADNSTPFIVMGEYIINVDSTGFTVTSKNGLNLRPSGITEGTPNFTVTGVYGV